MTTLVDEFEASRSHGSRPDLSRVSQEDASDDAGSLGATLIAASSVRKVGRPPKKIDPSLSSWHEFCVQLQQLKIAAGDPTFTELAAAIGFVQGHTLSRAVGIPPEGKPLRPGKWDYIGPYVTALGGDLALYRARYEQACRGIGIEPDPTRPPDTTPTPPSGGSDQHNGMHRRMDKWVQPIVVAVSIVALLIGILSSTFAHQHDVTNACSGTFTGACVMSTDDPSSGALPYAQFIVQAGSDSSPPILYAAPNKLSAVVTRLTPSTIVSISCQSTDSALRAQVVETMRRLDAAHVAAQAELDGTGGTHTPGAGPAYRLKQQAVADLSAELVRLEDKLKQSRWYHVAWVYGEANGDSSAVNTAGWMNNDFLSPVGYQWETPECPPS